MATRMQQRRGTAAQWVSTNSGNGPILNAGEIGYETDTNKFKIGDGTNHWINLDYFIDANSTVNPAFGSSITFEGATANAFETTIQVTDPTADRTITLPDATGTVVLADGSGNVTVSGDLTVSGTTTTINSTTINATTGIVFEGLTANAFETTLAITDPTADRTLTLPDSTGTLATQAYVDTASANATFDASLAAGAGLDWNATTDQFDVDSTVATKSYTDSAVETHNLDTTNVHGITDTTALATKTYADTAVSTHSSDTTSVHGIADTSLLATTANVSTAQTAAQGYADSAVGTHNADITDVHGISNTADLATKTYADTAVSTHSSDTTNVHGIADTSNLATKTYADTSVSTHSSDTTSVHGITDTAALATKAYADNAVSTHQSDTTDVHGIADTSALALTANVNSGLALKANLAGPTFTGTVTVPTLAITTTATGITKTMVGLANVDNTTDANKPVSTATQTELNLKANLAAPTFTGTVVLPSTTSIGDVSATELGYLDGVTSSIQTQLTALLPLAGGTMTGALTLSGAPTSDLHAATKLYVDNVTAGINFHEAVHAASVSNLSVNYSNGTSGVGATLTADTNRVFSTLDGESVALGQRVLIKNQTDAKQNGIYTLTTVGSVSAPWVLTRATDSDNNPVGEMKTGDFVFVINGTVNASVGYINNSATNPIVIGTDSISYTEFSAGKTVVAGSGLTEATPGTLSIATGAITSAMIADGAIVDADVNASAAIAQSKISGLTSDLAAKAPLASPTFTGTVSVSASGIAFTDGTQTLEGVPSRTPIIQKTASYTLSSLTERDDLIEMGSASAITLSIPTDATLNYPIGTSIDILQTGLGQVTIAAVTPGTTTVNATPGLKLRTQWSSCTLFKRAANTWVVYGDLTA